MRGSLVRARSASATSAGRQWVCMSIMAVMAVPSRGVRQLNPAAARRKAGRPYLGTEVDRCLALGGRAVEQRGDFGRGEAGFAQHRLGVLAERGDEGFGPGFAGGEAEWRGWGGGDGGRFRGLGGG